jgi:hypothetical protein
MFAGSFGSLVFPLLVAAEGFFCQTAFYDLSGGSEVAVVVWHFW